MSTELGDALRKGRETKGLSQQQVADALRVSRAAVGQWERGTNAPATARLIEACRLLDLDIVQVTGGAVKLEPAERYGDNFPAGTMAVIDRRHDTQLLLDMPQAEGFPVYGMRILNDRGDVRLDGAPIEYRRRIPTLSRLSSLYGVYVTTATMSPRFEVGELALVSGARPAKVGDYVLLEIEGYEGQEVWRLGRLSGRGSDHVQIEQFSPAMLETIPLSNIRAIHRILGTEDIIG